MKTTENPADDRQSRLRHILRFLRFGVWKDQVSPKVTLAIDRRLLLVAVMVAIYGLIKITAGFDGVEVVLVADTVDSSSRWPHSGGRAWIRSYEWWGLKGVGLIAERRVFVEEDDPQKTKQTRWMIIETTGPRIDKWGQELIPRPLFVDVYLDSDQFGTGMAISNTDLRWFDRGRFKKFSN